MSIINLVEGAFYERRDGVRVGPAEKLLVRNGDRFTWTCGEWTYDVNGKFSYSNNERDLVKQVAAPRKERVA